MIVIGAGRVGQALALADPQVKLIDRQRGWEALDAASGEPIIVATRNDDLAQVIARVPAHRQPDLVFVQNGMLRDFLADAGLATATRGLLFFAVSSRGETLKPGGTSPFCGPHAKAVVDWCEAHGVPARVADADTFAWTELEKLIWNCAFGLMCEVHEATVGRVVEAYREQLLELIGELAGVGAPAMGLELDGEALRGLADRCCAYSRSIPDYRGAVKEWPWRNGWFVQRARREGRATPLHVELLTRVGQLPRAAEESP